MQQWIIRRWKKEKKYVETQTGDMCACLSSNLAICYGPVLPFEPTTSKTAAHVPGTLGWTPTSGKGAPRLEQLKQLKQVAQLLTH